MAQRNLNVLKVGVPDNSVDRRSLILAVAAPSSGKLARVLNNVTFPVSNLERRTSALFVRTA